MTGYLPLTFEELSNIAAAAGQTGVPMQDLAGHTETAAKCLQLLA